MKRRYPTQEDCQLLIDAMNQPPVYYGACSPEFRKFGEKLSTRPKNWEKMFDKCFGSKSPWNVRIKETRGGHRRELYWDKEKAKQLGIN